MGKSLQVEAIGRLLGDAARAHHAVFGGPNDGWSRWYAEWMYGALLGLTASAPSVDLVQRWLEDADTRYRATDPDGTWPGHYATWIAEWDAGRM